MKNFYRRIKDWRRIATRYDKLAPNFLATTTLVGSNRRWMKVQWQVMLYWIKL
jgi:transposase